MTHVAVVGGGPAGLSAALFAAKNGLEVTLFDADETPMHRARLFNYLGVDEGDGVDGTTLVERARRQTDRYGVDRRNERVTELLKDGSEFVVTTDEGECAADYLVLASGRVRELAADVDCERAADGTVVVDTDMRTTTPRVYAAGWAARAEKIQAIISAGDGAVAALDILSEETGEPFRDFDVSSEHDANASD
ncbi:NAD(P)/FAD-dependent oxidoreductase [Haloprofundus halophilus]|uniref:NAD(P)/FAD-dependent oxidoreductase n=1 Tax=Haloprofundus halophilus TaxID=2283527 RepID=UPI000E43421C|nr:NAD(P)/FAD-dependent oxidoreductase [Haloprofundus halophilus]